MASNKKGLNATRQRRVNPAYEKPFEVSAQAIANLTSEQFVAFVAHLIRAEVAWYGGPPSDLLGNFALGVDGGRDAYTNRNAPPKAGDSLVPQGETIWQCKAEEKKPDVTELAAELAKEKPLACLERGGSYTFVAQKPDRNEDETDAMLKSIALLNGFDEERVRFFAQSGLAEFARRHPSLSFLEFFPVRPEGLEPFDLWDRDHVLPFEPSAHSQKLADLIAGIRAGRFHVAVAGPTGVGKSRIVLEAIRQLQLEGFVAYARSPGVNVNKLVDHIRMQRASCILVVDECDEHNAGVLRELLSTTDAGLITIGADREGLAWRPPSGDTLVRLQPLPENVISKVLEGNTGLSADARAWIASQTGGFIKLAQLVGTELARDDAALGDLGQLSASTEVERALIRMMGNDAKKVELLKLLACFATIDSSPGIEGSELSRLAEKLGLSSLQVESMTARAKQEQILADTGSLLYVTPDLLAQWLLESFLRFHSGSFTAWLPTLSDRLRAAHARQLERLRGTPGGRVWAAKLVSTTGPFGDLLARRQPWADDALLALGAAAKIAVAEYLADWARRTPDAAAQIAERSTLRFTLFRVMRAPEGFAQLFPLLVDSFVAAGGRVGGSLWQTIRGMLIADPLASTLAPYKNVVDAVSVELQRRTPEVRAALVEALGHGLNSSTGEAYSEYDREPDDHGRDRTPLEAIRAAVALLASALDDPHAAPRKAASDVLLHAARAFAGSPLADDYFDLAPKAVAISGDIETFAQELDAIIAYDNPAQEVAARVRALRAGLATDLRSRLRLVMGGWSILDSDEDGVVRPNVVTMSHEILQLDPEALKTTAAIMFEPWAKNPGELLSALAKVPDSDRLWCPLLDAGRAAENAWPCAIFLAGARDERRHPSPDVALLLSGDRFDVQVGALATTMSASTDAEVQRLADLLAGGEADPAWTRGCYMGRWNERVSEAAVVALIKGLVANPQGAGVAVSLCFRTLESKQTVPSGLAISALSAALPIAAGHDLWTWQKVGFSIAKTHPRDLFDVLVKTILDHGVGRADDEVTNVLGACCERVSRLAEELLGLWERHRYFVTHKLGSIITRHVSVEALVLWARGSDRKERALGEMVIAADTPLTVSLIEAFGENSRLASAVEAEAGSGSWSGSLSVFYESRGREWMTYAARSNAPRFTKFAERVGKRLLASAEQARNDEAKEDALER